MNDEKALLGSLILDFDYCEDSFELVGPSHFHDKKNQTIFRAVQDLNRLDCPIELLSVSDRLMEGGNLSKIGGYGYLMTLTEDCPNLANADLYAARLKKRAQQEEIVRAGIGLNEAILEGNVGSIRERADLIHALEDGGQDRFLKAGYTTEQILAEAIPYPEWIADNLCLKNQVNIIAGSPGTGKSYLALAIAVCAAAGKKIIGADTNKPPVKTIYIGLEGGSQFRRRAQEILRGYEVENADFLLLQENPGLWENSNRIKFFAEIKRKEYQLVVIDTFRKAFRLREDNKEGWIEADDYLTQMAKYATVLLTHHTTKSSGRNGSGAVSVDDISGGGELSAGVDYALILKQENDSVVVYNPKSNPTLTVPPRSMEIVSHGSQTWIELQPAEEKQLAQNQPLREKFLEYLSLRDDWVSVNCVRKHFKMRHENAARILDEMVRLSDLSKDGDGRYKS